ncbi:MAG: DUF3102 domain-containing protein [Caldilineaceae bacterium]|nr:DUF3102 domain-containing protein [Caldilineaceae bacterium]
MTQIVQMGFDYAALDSETRIVVQQRTSEIKTLMRRSAQDIIDIGQKLIEVKARLGHGNFGGWLESEFSWTPMTAQRFMQVAERFKNNNLLDLSIAPSALYALAAPSTPEPARAEAIERAQAGEAITHSAAKTIIEEHRASPSAHVWAGDDETEDIVWIAPEPSITEVAQAIGDRLAANVDSIRTSPHVAHNSGNNEWYTPVEYIDAARAVLGAIDLDPASSTRANEVVRADHYFTAEDDGLSFEWAGRVWMNPPYSSDLIGRFCSKLAAHHMAGEVAAAIVLVNNATETSWFVDLVNAATAIVFPRSRVRFWKPDGDTGAPLQGQAIVYMGGTPSDFLRVFRRFGWGMYVG